MATAESSESSPTRPRPGRVLRWTLAGGVLASTIVAATISSGGRHLRVCPDGIDGPCRALEITDAPILLVLAFVCLLLLPDLSRVRIGGLLELETRVTAIKKDVVEARGEIAELRQTIEATASAASTAQSGASAANQLNVTVLGSGEAVAALQSLEAKFADLEANVLAMSNGSDDDV